MQQNRRQVLSLLAALLAGGAGGLIATASVAQPLRIIVEPFEVQGLYIDRALVNRTADRRSPGRSLIGPPSLLFGDVLVDHLRASYGRDSVLAQQTRFGGDIRLRPVLQRLERVSAEGGAQALLAIDFVVDAGGAPLGRLAFSEVLPAGDTPAEYLAAQAQLLASACEQSRRLVDCALSAYR